MKKAMTSILSMAALMLLSVAAIAQTTVKGVVVDGSTNETLPGASVIVPGTTTGTVTGFDGAFVLEVPDGTKKLLVSFVGFRNMEIVLSGASDLGTIKLDPDTEVLSDVVVVGYGIVDLAKDRQTPIAVSTVKASEIALKAGNQEFPELMKSTPSVYTTKSGGGFGDSRMSLRGFDQSNTAFLINGQPINGMEDGKMYWSNWQGVLDVANAVQVQRGLGSSKLAISSVGGTVNVVTKTVDKKEGGFVQAMLGNDNYRKTTAYYSTGLSEKGWSFSTLLGHWEGDGYNDHMGGKGQTYFFSVGYVPNKKHTFNFLITGAPQRHYQRNRYKLETLLEKGAKYNDSWGRLNGKFVHTAGNYYHKPIANLSWDWKISEKSNLSTVVYASWGRGGSIGLRNYANDIGDSFDLDATYASNRSITPNANGDIVGDRSKVDGKRPYDILRSSVNAHNWYGVISNFNHKLNDKLSFNVGTDARKYHGEHFRRVVDFLGLDGWSDSKSLQQPDGHYVTESYSSNPWKATFADTPRNQRIGYDNPEDISYLGFFGQVEYNTGNFSTFFQSAVSTQTHQRFDYFNYVYGEHESKKVTNEGFNVKAGVNYNINENHNVFVNAGHYSRQPFQDNMFLNYRNDINPLLTNEKITGFEAGYGFRGQEFAANVNAYHTTWDDRVISGSYRLDSGADGFYNYQGVKQVHMGLEMDFTYRPTTDLHFNGYASIGKWEYDGNASKTVFDDDLNEVEGEAGSLYLDGVKVGDAAQLSLGLGARYNFLNGFRIDADWNFYDKLYAGFLPTDSEFETADNRGSVELPSYSLLDAGLSYDWKFAEKYKLVFRLNVNNVFDKTYIAESSTNIHAEEGDETYKGINVSNKAYFGFGRTWNFSVRLNF